MKIVKTYSIAIYNGDDRPIAIVLLDDKSRKNLFFSVEEMAFDDISDFLMALAKQDKLLSPGSST